MSTAPAANIVGRRSFIVEGWRFLPHSYALVNEYQLLELIKLNIPISVRDVPFYRTRWKAQPGAWSPSAEKALKSIEVAQPNQNADVTLRVFAPFDFSRSRSPLTAVFATLEQQAIRQRQLARGQTVGFPAGDRPDDAVIAITPSRWSAEGFYKAGFRAEQVKVIPHGVDTHIFRPSADVGRIIRNRLGLDTSAFVFLSVGGMSGNKGIDLLLRAFNEVNRQLSHTRLLLKGLDSLYPSKEFLAKALQTIPAVDRERVEKNTTYFSSTLSLAEMANLYRCADAYVSPYRAEGFNMPVLEAMASGIPVVCTGGGATDDFALDTFARKVSSNKVCVSVDGLELVWLEPELDDLIAAMMYLAENPTWRASAASKGIDHARAHFRWSQITERLVGALSSDGPMFSPK